MHLRVLAQSSSDPSEKRHAANVLKLLNRGRHWVLVCLLLSNVVVNESLPIFLHSVLGGGVAAVAVSTIMIFIFGEVIPQSICVRYGLSIGGTCAPFVLAMMYISGKSCLFEFLQYNRLAEKVSKMQQHPSLGPLPRHSIGHLEPMKVTLSARPSSRPFSNSTGLVSSLFETTRLLFLMAFSL